jgi:hypothetical protein
MTTTNPHATVIRATRTREYIVQAELSRLHYYSKPLISAIEQDYQVLWNQFHTVQTLGRVMMGAITITGWPDPQADQEWLMQYTRAEFFENIYKRGDHNKTNLTYWYHPNETSMNKIPTLYNSYVILRTPSNQ